MALLQLQLEEQVAPQVREVLQVLVLFVRQLAVVQAQEIQVKLKSAVLEVLVQVVI